MRGREGGTKNMVELWYSIVEFVLGWLYKYSKVFKKKKKKKSNKKWRFCTMKDKDKKRLRPTLGTDPTPRWVLMIADCNKNFQKKTQKAKRATLFFNNASNTAHKSGMGLGGAALYKEQFKFRISIAKQRGFLPFFLFYFFFQIHSQCPNVKKKA